MMKQIDFLPKKFRDEAARRRSGIWRLIVVAISGATIVAASTAQQIFKANVQQQIELVQPMLASAQSNSLQSVRMQDELNRITTQANLYAALKAPWPCTQIILAVVAPIDDSVYLDNLHVKSHASDSSPESVDSLTENQDDNSEANDKLPAQQDQAFILEQIFRSDRMVYLSGTAKSLADLHRYLARVAESPLIEHVQIISIDDASEKEMQSIPRFTAELLLRQPPVEIEDIGQEESADRQDTAFLEHRLADQL